MKKQFKFSKEVKKLQTLIQKSNLNAEVIFRHHNTGF